MKWNEENLKYRGRYLRTQPGKLLFGPAGERLAADYLEKQPGFVGRFDFIHKCNLPELFRVTIDCPMDFRKATADWYPSYLHMECEDRQIVFREDKWITRDDVAVSRQTWFNQSGEARVLRLLPGADICRSFGRMPHGYRVHEAVFSHSFDAGGSCLLPSGAAVTVTVCAGVGNQEQESREQLRERAVKAEALACQDTALAGHREAYGEFFQAIPEFVCSDQLLNKVWSYRWYLLKNSWAVPGWGKLPHGVMYEGRGHNGQNARPGQRLGIYQIDSAVHAVSYYGDEVENRSYICGRDDPFTDRQPGRKRIFSCDRGGHIRCSICERRALGHLAVRSDPWGCCGFFKTASAGAGKVSERS